MANANIDALYAGSLEINVAYVFPSNFTFYKWCVTKVAHCMIRSHSLIFPNPKSIGRDHKLYSLGLGGGVKMIKFPHFKVQLH